MADITTLPRFDPPANLDDIKDEAGLQKWSDTISGWMEEEIAGVANDNWYRTKLKYFFNGTKTAYDQKADPKKIVWTAFPKKVKVDISQNNEERWGATDGDRQKHQDEYCEFSVLREGSDHGDPAAPIKCLTFTCEGPEYWDFMGGHQPEETLKLIKELNEPYLNDAQMDWFFKKENGRWTYDKDNKYNNSSRGGPIISLSHHNNSLSAEVDIAAQGTVPRRVNGRLVTDADELIRISDYGGPERNSDPLIGGTINEAVRSGFTVTIANPVAIYMHKLLLQFLALDDSGNRDGTNMKPIPKSWIQLQRGSGLNSNNPMGLRLRIRNDDGMKTEDGSRELDISDIWDRQTMTNIHYGSQFLDYISMGVSGALGAKGRPLTIDDAEDPPMRRDFKSGYNVDEAMKADAEETGGVARASKMKVR